VAAFFVEHTYSPLRVSPQKPIFIEEIIEGLAGETQVFRCPADVPVMKNQHLLDHALILLPLKLRPPSRHGSEWTKEVARWQQNQPNP
jgi:hypothetical protein